MAGRGILRSRAPSQEVLRDFDDALQCYGEHYLRPSAAVELFATPVSIVSRSLILSFALAMA